MRFGLRNAWVAAFDANIGAVQVIDGLVANDAIVCAKKIVFSHGGYA